jgi:hypothetical protein
MCSRTFGITALHATRRLAGSLANEGPDGDADGTFLHGSLPPTHLHAGPG